MGNFRQATTTLGWICDELLRDRFLVGAPDAVALSPTLCDNEERRGGKTKRHQLCYEVVMCTTMTLKDLLDILVTMDGAFILENAHGSMELRGRDFYVNVYNEWLTIYHSTPHNPESQSHLHLKWPTLQSAMIQHMEGHTPHLAFYGTREPIGEPLLIWYFPSFYDWGRGKAEIPANIAQYETFVATYGSAVQLAALPPKP